MIEVTWDSSSEQAPAGGDAPTGGDDKFRDLQKSIRQRQERECIHGLSETQAKHGWHRQGSARVFIESSDPTKYKDVDQTTIGSDAEVDKGRLLFRSDLAYLPKVYDGGWQQFLREIARASIQGTLVAASNIVPPIVFPRACKVVKVTARVGTAPTGQAILIDVHKNGTNSVFATAGDRVQIAAAGYAGNSVNMHVTDSVLAADDYLTIDLDQVGSTIVGADLGITIEVIL